MAIVNRDVTARLRITGPEKRTVKTYQRVRPNINAADASALKSAVGMISELPAVGASLTVTSELSEEDGD